MTASALSAALHRIGQIQPHLPAPVSVLLALAAAVAAFVPGLWEIARHVTVIAHEAAHAVIGFGVISVAVTFAALFLIAGFASVGAQVLTAYVLAWFLLMSGIRIIVIHGTEAADAALLRGMTRIPRGFWSRLWLLGAVSALIFGATLLV